MVALGHHQVGHLDPGRLQARDQLVLLPDELAGLGAAAGDHDRRQRLPVRPAEQPQRAQLPGGVRVQPERLVDVRPGDRLQVVDPAEQHRAASRPARSGSASAIATRCAPAELPLTTTRAGSTPSPAAASSSMRSARRTMPTISSSRYAGASP